MNAFSPPNSARLDTELAYLPVFLGVGGRTALLIGGSEAALAKLDLLRRAGARVRLVAEQLDGIVRSSIADDARVSWVRAPLAAHHFDGAVVAIDASGDAATNGAAVRWARDAGVPINVVDRPALCDFILPAILDRSPVIVAVSTGGAAPAIARLIRQRLESAIPAGFGQVAMLAARMRRLVSERLGTARQRAAFWEQLFDGPAAELAGAGCMEGAVAAAHALIEWSSRLESQAEAVEVLDIASDDPDLLTVRAARVIRMADVVVYEAGIGRAILELARRDAVKIAAQTRGLETLTELTRPGRLVVHLRPSLANKVSLDGAG